MAVECCGSERVPKFGGEAVGGESIWVGEYMSDFHIMVKKILSDFQPQGMEVAENRLGIYKRSHINKMERRK